ncbi:hypothetical protein MF265_23310 [Serratia marcescens]|uniref:hypothetical protein n=1 Tax=Serratia marcescens TaxID=615 RepID=UPI001EF0B541|nr:hypothetical protein [Serratia marcescens]ULH10805.1 hypothetical protein MF265_23310 [Serratia marcescens]
MEDLDHTLDRIIITALFNHLNTESKKEVLVSIHEQLDRISYDENIPLTYEEQVERLELLREQLNSRLPESLEWSHEYLLRNY